MITISMAEATLLGLLSEGAMHPYQIETEVKERDMRFWTELSFSSIYKLLRRLEREGCVSSEVTVSEENRTRRVYRITEEGMAALREKLFGILKEPQKVVWGIDIVISNLTVLPKEEALSRLEGYAKKIEETIRCYGELEGYLKTSGCPEHRMALARRTVYLMRGERAWIKEYVERIKKIDPKKFGHGGNPHE